MDISTLLTNVLGSIVQTLAGLVFAALLALIPRALAYIKDSHLRAFVQTEVFSIEQTAAESLSGEAKKAVVLSLAQKRFPGVPLAFLTAVLEAAVHTLPANVAKASTVEQSFAASLLRMSSSAAPGARTASSGVSPAGGTVPPPPPSETAP